MLPFRQCLRSRLPHWAALLALLLLLPTASAPAAEPLIFRHTYAPAPADNPLKGFVPYAGQGQKFPHSLEFGYLPLAAMMTGPSTFDWAPMERLLDGITSRGCQAIFRIYLEYPGKPTGVPDYLVKSGVKLHPWTSTPKPDHTPDYEDPRLREALKSFVAALGARYDGDPRIGYITAGLLGSWGEWHCHPHAEWFASKAVQAEVMNAYSAAFQKTPVLLRYPAGENDSVLATNGHRGFGYHDDSFAWATLHTGEKKDAWFYLTTLRAAGPAAMDRWKTAPIGGEIRPELWPCIWKEEGCKQGQDFALCVRDTHATWLMESSTSRPLTEPERERALTAARSLGYEFHVLQASAELDARSLKITVSVTNRGVAPFYANWPSKLIAIDSAGGETTAELPLALNKLLPGDTTTQAATLNLANLKPGEAKLLLSVPNPLKNGKPLRFANTDQDRDRPAWLTLGKFAIP